MIRRGGGDGLNFVQLQRAELRAARTSSNYTVREGAEEEFFELN